MNLEYIFIHWHEIAYTTLSVVVIAAYVSHFFHLSKSLAKVVKTENLLIIILLFIMVMANQMESIGGSLKAKMDNLSGEMTAIIKLSGYAKVERLKDTDKMFFELLRSLKEAQSEVHVTSIRNESPDSFKSQSKLAQDWYKELTKWADQAPGRRLYRVIGTPNREMQEWFVKECGAKKRSDNYILESIGWDGKTPVINVVVFDRREAFLVFSPPQGPLAETEIFHISDADFSNLVIERYFRSILGSAIPCAGQNLQ